MESYHVLLVPEPREDNPAHATWGSNVSNAAKDIEAKEFLLGENPRQKGKKGWSQTRRNNEKQQHQ